MSKPAPSVIAALLVCIAGIAWGVVRPPNSAPNQDLPPEMKGDSGIVRVWNARDEPPLERDHTPEAKLGDAIVVEIKNLSHWLAENLEDGAWADDAALKDGDAVVKRLINERQLSPAIAVAEQLETLIRTKPQFTEDEQAAVAEADFAALAAELDSEQLNRVVWGDYHPKDENGAGLDPANPAQRAVAIQQCGKTLKFLRGFAEQKTAAFVLAINDIPLPGLIVETPEREAGWRVDNLFDPELRSTAQYVWYQFKLQGPHGSDFTKAWTRLMQAAGNRFSFPSKVALTLPGEKKPLPTNVTLEDEDLRCRFNLLAVAATATATPSQRTFKKGDAVYPLDERDLEDHVLKARVVEEPDHTSSTPYLVHFEEKGGTRRYAASELSRLPPDLIASGVVRVWNGNDDRITAWEDAQIDTIPQAKIGDTLVVELRNFGRWLARQVDNGFFPDEPLIVKAAQASKPLDEFIKAKNFSLAAKVGRKIHRILDDAPQTNAFGVVEKLERAARKDPELLELKFPKMTPIKAIIPSQDAATQAKELAAQQDAFKAREQEAQTFLAPFEAADSLLDELKAAKLRTLILSLNDIPLGITPDNSDYAPVPQARRPAGDPKDDTYYWLHYSLRPRPVPPTEDGKPGDDPFKRLMAHPTFTMPTKVALTLKTAGDTLVLPTAVTKDALDLRSRFNLIGIEKFKFWPMVFVFVLILGSLAFFAASTDILRDPARRRPEGVEPVSLARTQMAFWFVVIAAAFAFLWVTTGNIDTINGTCLTLLAIGTTTALTTMAVQRSRVGPKDLSEALQKTPHEMLMIRPAELKEAIAARKQELATTGATTMTPEELAETIAVLNSFELKLDRFLKQRPRWCPLRVYYWRYRLRTVLEDLLTEEAGTYDFHRFQMLAWTLVLGSVFVFKVFADRTMPQFDSNLLLLMGISSGAYIGFKVASPRKTDGAPPADDDTENAAKPA